MVTIPSSRTRSLWAVAAVAVALGLTAFAYLVMNDDPFWAMDLQVYRETGSEFASGDNPYPDQQSGLYFTYPPFAALLVVPLSLGSLSAAAALLILVSVACLMGAVWFALGLLGVRDLALRAPLTFGATFAVMWLQPVWDTFWLGQVNLIILFLVMCDLARDGRKGQGVLIGVAAGIKLMPGIFVLYLLVTGRVRAAVTATATFVGTVLLSLVVLPKAAWHFWTDAFFDTSRYGYPQNSLSQSLRSAVARVTHSPDGLEPAWYAASLVTVGAALVVAVHAERRGHRLLAIATVGMAGVLISPVAWEHHLVWAVPGFLFLLHLLVTRPATLAWRAGLVTLIGLLAALYVLSPVERVEYGEQAALNYSGMDQLIVNAYPLVGVLTIVVPAALYLARGRTSASRAPAAPPDAPARDGGPAPTEARSER
ncbi:glycosyltransferase 87 family protein [Streptomyces sp. 4N509B]|uniref:glycosyltransferase 87 family protein n=1 Tax=Streptomyces sp. 4N509B TaxID=3457413 RepID=UPI003FD26E8D